MLDQPRRETWSLPCPGKLNLGLRVLERRKDGYHNLQTVFQLLDFGDTLSIAPADELSLNDLPGVSAEHNLVMRAAHALQSYSGHTAGAQLTLTKQLPAGGGVGGGSSDAATALLGLNAYWGLNLDTSTLQSLALKLGADVPVFVSGHSVFAEGVGERFTPVTLPTRWYVVLTPPCHVSTGDLFQHKGLTRHTEAITVRAFLEGGGENDFERLVCRLYPEVAAALEWLGQFGPARLTGTGASVYVPFQEQHQALRVLRAKPSTISGFIAQGVNESPLMPRLRDVTGASR